MTQIVDTTEAGAEAAILKDAPYRTAKLSDFRAPTPVVLFGQRLKEVEALESSIQRHGLTRPLKVTIAGHKLVVMDGRKRLSALRRMRFKNTLPRSLVSIPFVVNIDPIPHVLSVQDQYHKMVIFKELGNSANTITYCLCISAEKLRALESIETLSPRLKRAFLDKNISLNQAQAYASIASHRAQENLLIALGPFAKAPEISRAITAYESDMTPKETLQRHAETETENVITMPSPPLEGLSADGFARSALIAA